MIRSILNKTAVVSIVVFLVAQTSSQASSEIPDFCFIHTSDNHLSPEPVGTKPAKAGDVRYDGLAWMRDEACKPQEIKVADLNVTTPKPSFIINTGDVTEFGVINTTFDTFESIFKDLPIPLFITPGNHDNTWTNVMQVMRARHGGDHYSFEKFGCHFVCIDSSTPQEPLPTLEKRTIEWLNADLRKVSRETPVFVFCHHQLSSSEFAKPFEQVRLLEVLDRYNVVLVMVGHGHGHGRERWNGIDSVMGGTTSHPAAIIGYNIIWLKDGVLNVAFRYRDPAKPMELTLQKPITPRKTPDVQFLSPRASGPNPSPLAGNDVPIRLQVRDGKPTKITATLDADDATAITLTPGRAGVFEGKIKADNAVPGMHFVMTTTEFGPQKLDHAEEVLFAPAGSPNAARTVLKSGVKAQPVLTPDGLIVATTGGEVACVSFENSRRPTVKTLFNAGVEILHAPAVADGQIYVSAAEKGVHRLTSTGELVWACEVGAPAYGTPALDPDFVYVADMQGSAHAINRKTGKLAWSKRHASFSVEMPVLLRDGVLYFGAWDNMVYAVNAKDGSLKWSKMGPAAHTGESKYKSRYYAPADCALVAVGDRLFVTDRAYFLGSYNTETGEYLGQIETGIAAIGPTPDGKGFFARGLSKGLTRYDGQGKVVWSQAELPTGRFPVAPVESNGKVFVCSNRGTVTVHDAADGKVLLTYQATPQLHVMAAVAADSDGTAYVGGMDGSVTRIAASK